MKRILLISIILAAMLLSAYGCSNTPAPQQDIARYTADQVIYAASASPYSNCGFPATQTKWMAVYQGSGRWLVTKYCLSRLGGTLSTEQYYFYENTGEFTQTSSQWWKSSP